MLTKISRASRSPLLTLLPFLVSFGVAAGLNARPPAQDAPKPPTEQEKTKAVAPSAADGDYVGSETCITCHQDQDHRFKNTPMGRVMAHPRTPEDRKSTRLNSSHITISYAVFCLKKKKKNT